jgi:hypothetical protein
MAKKRVMLIGDSIRMLYQAETARLLEDDYEVYAPEENVRFVKYTLNELERWFDKYGVPDIIHWNNGLWDTSVVCKEDGPFTPIPEFMRYIDITLRELRKRTDKIIFATITPVIEAGTNQHPEYIEEYNRHLVRYMRSENVPVNDLFSLCNADVRRYIGPDNIHISAEGQKLCAQAVAKAVRSIDR